MNRSVPSLPASLDDALEEEWTRWTERGLARTPRPAWHRRGASVITEDGPAVDFSSNDYLGLATDSRVAGAAAQAIAEEGVGATASRLIAGTHREHAALEVDLASFFAAGASVAFATGYSANAGAISALVGPRDAVFCDALNHASLIDGCRLSRATVHTYPHADMGVLRDLLATQRATARRALIVTDGLFSMDGDLTPLADIVALARTHGAWTYLDDAHAVGVLGTSGRGTAEHLGLRDAVDVTVGTLGKAFGVAGAFVYGSRALCRHLLNHARSFVFSTAPLPAQAAAARESLRIVAAEPIRRERLRSNARRLRSALQRVGVAANGAPDAHVVPVLIGATDDTVRVGAELRARGLLVGAVRPPTVPDGTSRLRISVSAAHTDDDVDRLASALAELLPRSA
ncbi:MAG TPA: 8-amino-7-oxononanoate synthase [Gemmatimonadaceae bacterium]|nr:8-amino-7-oxononanoate synthase [Gemmatimonadaceae bacterium]